MVGRNALDDRLRHSIPLGQVCANERMGTFHLVVDGDTVTFIATGGPLSADDYTFTLRGAADGFKDLHGYALDGDNDGAAGGDFVGSFAVAPESILEDLAWRVARTNLTYASPDQPPQTIVITSAMIRLLTIIQPTPMPPTTPLTAWTTTPEVALPSTRSPE